MNRDLSEILSEKYDWVWSFREGLAMVELSGKSGKIDKDGNEYFD